MTTERTIQRRIILSLSNLGVFCWAHDTGTGLAPSILTHRLPTADADLRAIAGRTLGDLLDGDRVPDRLRIPRAIGRRIAFGFKGSPDVIGILPGGRFVGVEVKKPGGKQRKDQRTFEAAVKRVGGVYLVATSPEEAVAAVRPLIDAALND